MGAANSKVEEDKALQLCRERKRFVKQALEARSSLAEAHVAYIQSLKATGTALRKFAEPEPRNESSLYTSTNATSEPLPLTDKSLSQFSFTSPSFSHRVDTTESTASPPPSPPISTQFRADHLKFKSDSSKEVEERISSPAIGTVITSDTPPDTTPGLAKRPDSSHLNGSHFPPGTPPWDYFGLSHPIDHQFSFQEGNLLNSNQGLENADHIRRLGEVKDIPDLEEDEERSYLRETGEESQESENEFDEPSTDTLIRRFENIDRGNDQGIAGPSSKALPSGGSVAPEEESLNGEGSDSPDATSSLKSGSSAVAPLVDGKKEVGKNDTESNIEPKDFITSIRHIERLFEEASESGKEVPRMLEVNMSQLSVVIPPKKSVSLTSVYLRACFSWGQGRRQVQEEPAQAAIKYLTLNNMVSPSPSSLNPLQLSSMDNFEGMKGNVFNNFGMASGSHASTLDRLYAWERKLCDEVKASEIIRKEYDWKCKALRKLESKAQTSQRIDKARADVKDLHSRIGVAIHRIDSISKKIEELRDKELQPQLEELIEGFGRMWDEMFECHRLQYQIMAVALSNNTKLSVFSESQRQITIGLESELTYLSLSFTNWVGAQETYFQAMSSWLLKCITLSQKSFKKKKRPQFPHWRRSVPPIYATCEVWLEKLRKLPSRELVDSITNLAAETHKFAPRQGKSHGKGAKRPPPTSREAENRAQAVPSMSRDDEAPEDLNLTFDRFRSRLVEFLDMLSQYSGSSVNMYRKLKEEIVEAKNNYDRQMSRPRA
ncbi:hypothetical protein SAY87_013009 [Trapa incisa]|uniref:Uncharacterized protein n=1 Tax=Trapa incisa TaxID=236973 RepID=A0AAN7KB54_9MYRT|nr:hypothetical protein SAY87_013009 [Trapa incisa]